MKTDWDFRVLTAFLKGIGQLSDRPTRKIIWFSLAAALATFIVLWIASGYFLLTTTFILTTALPISWQDIAFVGTAVEGFEVMVDVLGVLFVLILTWFLFPAAFSAVTSLFLERAADLVDQRHYPDLPPADGMPLQRALIEAAKFLGLLLAVYAVVLPLWLILPGGFLIYYAATGYLLGREYFELVALRRMSPRAAKALRKENGSAVFIAGVVIAVIMTIPVVNLLMPIVATAAMVHLCEAWRKGRSSTDLEVQFTPENIPINKGL